MAQIAIGRELQRAAVGRYLEMLEMLKEGKKVVRNLDRSHEFNLSV